MEKNVHGEEPRPRVGVGILIQNEKGEILMGLRKVSHGSGEWCSPGGHVEFGERLFEAAQREVKEETGLDVNVFELVSVADEMRYIESDGKHYVNIGVRARYEGGEPRAMEPEKCEVWKWFAPEHIPVNLFEATAIILRNVKEGKIYQP